MASTFATTPPGNTILVKAANITRSMTTATEVLTIPKGHTIIGMTLVGTASDAATSATLSLGTAASGTAYVTTRDVKTVGTGTGLMPLTLAADHSAALTLDTKVMATYAETGTASTVGAWVLLVFYSLLQK